ncbi:MAG TPA: hypothetical protein VD813_14875 [Pseudonocardia sp.]|nr:hypothetical protein [Pseudonocardia sp.]
MITWAELAGVLRESAAGRVPVAVHVAGRPGGLVRVQEGLVVGTWSTGTPLTAPLPGPAGATSARAAGGGPRARAVMADAVFVIAAGRPRAWRREECPPAVSTRDGMDVERLLREVQRRLAGSRLPTGPLRPEDDRVRRVAPWDQVAGALLTPQEKAVIEQAEVECTLRDLAFALDRGVFGVALDVLHLVEEGLLTMVRPPDGLHADLVPPASRPPRGQGRPAPGQRAGTDDRADAHLVTVAYHGAEALVRRVPGASGSPGVRRRYPWMSRRAEWGADRHPHGETEDA